MTGRPETLEESLAWLESHAGTISFGLRGVHVSASGAYVVGDITDGDIAAAIVEAVGELWEQVNGEGE